jgi:hypothetical protein
LSGSIADVALRCRTSRGSGRFSCWSRWPAVLDGPRAGALSSDVLAGPSGDQDSAAHDYHAMYERVSLRRRLGYPPFGRLVRMTYSHTAPVLAGAGGADGAAVAEEAGERDREPGHPGAFAGVRGADQGRWRWTCSCGGDRFRSWRGTLPRGWVVDVDPWRCCERLQAGRGKRRPTATRARSATISTDFRE